MAKKRVFMSFRGEDRDKVNGLRLLAANPYFDLEFYDESVRDPYDSDKSEYIKKKIREKISRSSVTICFISEETHTSGWVDWELKESHSSGNSIIVMALKGVERAQLPAFVKKLQLKFHAWNPEALNDLIEES